MDTLIRAESAKNLLNDSVFAEAVEKVEKRQVQVFLSGTSTPEDREEAHYIVIALGKVKAEIQRMINDGKAAERKHK